jgi:hypothetical protein
MGRPAQRCCAWNGEDSSAGFGNILLHGMPNTADEQSFPAM